MGIAYEPGTFILLFLVVFFAYRLLLADPSTAHANHHPANLEQDTADTGSNSGQKPTKKRQTIYYIIRVNTKGKYIQRAQSLTLSRITYDTYRHKKGCYKRYKKTPFTS